MEVKTTVQLTPKQLFEFLLRHTYKRFSGYAGIALSVFGLVGFVYTLNMPEITPKYKFGLLVIGLLFTVFQPYTIYQSAKKQAKVYAEYALHYTIDEAGISVVQGDATGNNTWDDVIKIVSTKRLIMIYTGRMHAYVIPRANIGDDIETLRTIIKDNCKARYINL